MLFRQHRGCRTATFDNCYSGIGLERPIIEGDNPVHEIMVKDSSILSRAGHVKSCLNRPEPSGKAKYS